MNMFTQKLASVIAVGLMLAPCFAADSADKLLVFNTTAPTNDLRGTLSARVQFAQSQIVPAHLRKGDNQPHLIGQRKSLLLVRPLKADGTTPMQVTARDKAGKELGSLRLTTPEKLPTCTVTDFAATMIQTQAVRHETGNWLLQLLVPYYSFEQW